VEHGRLARGLQVRGQVPQLEAVPAKTNSRPTKFFVRSSTSARNCAVRIHEAIDGGLWVKVWKTVA